MATSARRFIGWNRKLSRWERSLVARVVPGCARVGPRDFQERVLPGLLVPNQRVLDVGGGKHPAIPLPVKQELGLHVVGLDVDASELAQAPSGAYDDAIVGDVATVAIRGRYDLVVSRSVMEHVGDPRAAVTNLASALAPGGVMAHVMPCRNAPFAIVNRALGNELARRLLFAIAPRKQENSGFRAYYRDCTPARMSRLCRECGLEVITTLPYYNSGYTSFFAPLYTVELLRQALMAALQLENFSESFALVARVRGNGAARPQGRDFPIRDVAS
jgi:SAM-dependent methyltransferase